MTLLLLIEDDTRVSDFLARGLKAEGYGVTVARTGPEGLEHGRTGAFEVIVLDLMLPRMHGHEVCRELRLAGLTTPVLMLTALGSVEDKVDGLRLGADDYMTKPFAFDELLARIEALARRNRGFAGRPTRLQAGGLTFDRDSLEVHRDGRRIELTAKELAILELLMSAPGKVFSRARILANVWGSDADPLTNVVDVYIARLRRKIDRDGAPALIATVRGYGYKLAAGQETGVE